VKIYRVGGSVRDELLGRAVQDHDYVVVGATPEQMVALGYQPVGKDFPVFLHPTTREEHALARTERKSGRGYKGFTVHTSPEVTLEEDLARRDLTINAMARDASGALIDPFGGLGDLERRCLRHVSPAFVEDPVRILRVARFAARLDFTVAEDTLALMRHMVETGEADHLVPERVWQELARGLMEARPSVMFALLWECGAMPRIAPEWADLLDPGRAPGRQTLARLDRAAALEASLPVRFALASHRAGDALPALGTRVRCPNDCLELATLCARHITAVRTAPLLDAGGLVDLLVRGDALRRPGRFFDMLWIAALEDEVEPGIFAPRVVLERALRAAQSVDAQAIANRQAGPAVADHIRAARIAAVRDKLQS
jgi:tRNA nucleotidyltransferase (CCA-adding enzyme)